MSLYNSNNSFDDDKINDDFDVDFNDSLGYGDSPSKTRRTRRTSKDTKKAPKKQIKVDTKKTKKKTSTKSTTAKKTVKPKTENKAEPKKTVKEVKEIKVVKRTSKDRKTPKKTVKEEKKVVKEEVVETVKQEEPSKPLKKIEKEELPTKEEEKQEPQEIIEEKPLKKEVEDDFEDIEIELEEEEVEEDLKQEEKELAEEIVEPEEVKEDVEEKEYHKVYKTEEDQYDVSLLKVLKVKFKKFFRNIKRYKKPLIISAAVLLVLLAGFLATKFGLISISFSKPEGKAVVVKEKDVLEEYRSTWESYEEINSDYVGQIIFDSQLINKPFVQATSCYKENGVPYKFYNQDGSIVADFSDKTGNDVYIWMDFETMKYDYDKKGGSIFMDYRNVLSDQNLIIYGHYFSTIYNKDPDRVKSFTPLEKLLEKENYKDNSRVIIVLEDEIRTYDLYAVYKFDSESDEYWEKGQYFRPNYNVDDYTGEKDSDYMNNYIKFIDKVKLYKTDVTLEPGDKTLTLQTCMTPSTTLFEICVFKQVDVTKY